MLTKIPVELIQGNGPPNMLVTNIGSSLDISTVPALPGVTISAVAYDQQAGIMTIFLSNGDTVSVNGFVRAIDLAVGPNGNPGTTGLNGVNGLNGLDGTIGPIGPIGYQGIQGIQGLPGPQGYAGGVGLVGYPGINGAQGPAGPAGPIGPKGAKGLTGDAGRSGFLPILITDKDPGAVGAGTLWVNASDFTYGTDIVNFTVTGNIQDVICQNTKELLSIVSGGNSLPDWWSTKEIHNTGFDTVAANYIAHTLMNQSVVLVANYMSVNGLTTVVSYGQNMVDVGLLKSPKCCASTNTIYIIDQNVLYEINSNLKKTNVNVSDVNDIIVNDGMLYISTETGFFTYNLDTYTLNKYGSSKCRWALWYLGKLYIAQDSTTLLTDLNNAETVLSGLVVISSTDTNLLLVDYSDGVTVYDDHGSLLWHNPNFTFYKDNLILNESSYYSITPVGPRFVIETRYCVEIDENWVIEHDESFIFITEK